MINRKEITFGLGSTISSAMDKLHQLSNSCDNEVEYYGMFNGHELTSTMSNDEGFNLIIGINEDEFKAMTIELSNTVNNPKFNIIKDYKSRARGIIRKDRLSKWDEIVPIRVDDLYNGIELGITLTLVEMLDVLKCPFVVVKAKFISQEHSGMSANLMFQMLKEFSIHGEEFVSYMKE